MTGFDKKAKKRNYDPNKKFKDVFGKSNTNLSISSRHVEGTVIEEFRLQSDFYSQLLEVLLKDLVSFIKDPSISKPFNKFIKEFKILFPKIHLIKDNTVVREEKLLDDILFMDILAYFLIFTLIHLGKEGKIFLKNSVLAILDGRKNLGIYPLPNYRNEQLIKNDKCQFYTFAPISRGLLKDFIMKRKIAAYETFPFSSDLCEIFQRLITCSIRKEFLFKIIFHGSDIPLDTICTKYHPSTLGVCYRDPKYKNDMDVIGVKDYFDKERFLGKVKERGLIFNSQRRVKVIDPKGKNTYCTGCGFTFGRKEDNFCGNCGTKRA
jgi:hypothetical protein